MIIALASPTVATSLEDGLTKVEHYLSEASAQNAEIVCFPEAYLPGLRGQDFDVFPFDKGAQADTIETVTQLARKYKIATILGVEKLTEAGRQIAAAVVDAQGQFLGYQTKNQIDPSEDPFYVPGNTRQIFTINGLKFGIAICHEGWRYPETVRWAAVRGAKIVFHPQHTGVHQNGLSLTHWGSTDAPYYERAMMMRSIENTIYFASVNYGVPYPEAATSLIDPLGQCQAHLPYGQEGLLVQKIDIDLATGLIAKRYAPDRYADEISR
ncbi:MAG: carbon-nitrogen hydrolase family protein [Chloroflexota bacterium]